jgi:hypothetical protein
MRALVQVPKKEIEKARRKRRERRVIHKAER